MIEVIEKNWLDVFLKELRESEEVFLISPFVTDNTVNHLLKNRQRAKIRLITRFNLNDFRSKVSSLSALKKLVENGVEIKGIKGLHSKVYIFQNRSTIIGSANFTSGGFFNNYEFGIKSNEVDTIQKSLNYFKSLWKLDCELLNLLRIEQWEKEIQYTPSIPDSDNLNDYGINASVQGSKNRNYFIKLFGKTEYREGLEYTSRQEIERSHCHWALTFSGKKGRPRKYNEGDVVYMARMLHGTDYAIFGKGIALSHVDKRDYASDEDIKEIDWKKDWPVYIRVKATEFIDGKMADCPKMSKLIHDLQYDSFDKTRQRYLDGGININAWDSLRQQADVQLSEIAAEWMETKFQEAKANFGSVPVEYLSNLYAGNPTLDSILKSQITLS